MTHQVSNYILLTLIWEFHHVAYMPCQFCQICSCSSIIKQTSKLPNHSQQNVVADLTYLGWQRSQDGRFPIPIGVVVDEVGRSGSGGLDPEVGDRPRLPVASQGREAAVEHGPVRLAAHARRLARVPENKHPTMKENLNFKYRDALKFGP